MIAAELGFSGIDFTVGPYFAPARGGSAAVQVDLLFDRADDVITVCEMKYSRHPPGIEVIDAMEKKLGLIAHVAGRKTLQPVLIVRGRVSQELTAAGYFYRIIAASEAFVR